MANLVGKSLFTSAITGLNSSYLMMLNGADSLSLEDILNYTKANGTNYTMAYNQNFRSYLMSNFNTIDTDNDGKISTQDLTNYSNRLQTQGMTYQELSQLCASNSGTMSTLLDTVLSNFNAVDTNHDGRVTQGEIDAYRINNQLKDVKKKFPKIDPTRMSMFIETDVKNVDDSDTDKVFNK